MRTSFHHQPEAQHPHSPAIYTPVGRLLHSIADKRGRGWNVRFVKYPS
jgi:hypothetical protein